MSVLNTPENPFVAHRTAMLATASQMYRADLAGESIEGIVANVMPIGIGDMSENALREARFAEAQVTAGARTLARHASYEDLIERGGVVGFLNRVERRLARIADRNYLRDELDPAGLVAVIRSNRS